MKKIIATVLAFVMLLGTVAIGVPEEGIRLDFGLRAFAASEVASGTCGKDLTWVLTDDGKLTISGSGVMYNWGSEYSVPWYSNRSDIKAVEITGATSIGERAFYYCTSLTGVTIPDSVTSIGDGAFYGCTSLTSITIPDSVTSIGNRAFYECYSLTSITIPDSVTSIGDYAFYYCGSLTSVTIPDSVTSIGDGAFSWCYSLTSITIPDSVTSIGDRAFRDCDSLTSITIPDSVTYIGGGAFYDCDSLTSVTIPDSVTSIGDSAFYNCTSLTSVAIPDSVTSIGDFAFGFCDSLVSINVDKDNEYYSSIDGILYYKNAETLISCPGGKKDNVTIPDSVTYIGDSAFWDCDSLTSVTITDSVTTIGASAFVGCNSLTKVTIPDSVTSIGDYAFHRCTSLTSITIENPSCELYDSSYTISSTATIYGYSGSTAEAYAQKYGRNFVALAGDVETLEEYLFFEYPLYLYYNAGEMNAANRYIDYVEETYLDVLSEQNNTFLASYVTSLSRMGGVEVLLRSALNLMFPGTVDSIYDQYVDDATLMLMKKVNSQSTVASDTLEQIEKALEIVKKNTGFLSDETMYELIEECILTIRPRRCIRKLCEALYEEVDTLDGMLDEVGRGISVMEIIFNILAVKSIELETIETLIDSLEHDSDLKYGLERLLERKESEIVEDTLKQFLNREVINEMADIIIMSAGGGAATVAKIIIWAFTDVIYEGLGGVTADEIVECTLLASFTSSLGNALDSYRIQFYEMSQQGIRDVRKVKEYKLILDAYLKSISCALESSKECVKAGRDKKYKIAHIDRVKEQFEEIMTVESYINMCGRDMVMANTSRFSYFIFDGEIVITGLANGSQAVNKSISKMTQDDLLELFGDVPDYGILYIPAQIDGYEVTGIGDDAFSDNHEVEVLIVGDNVEFIGKSAFRECSGLETAILNREVESIGENAFENCGELNNIRLSENMASIGANAFANCSSLTKVEIPADVTSLDSSSFSGSALTDVVVRGLTNIPEGTFGRQTTIYGMEDSPSQEYSEAFDVAFEKISLGIERIEIESEPDCLSYSVNDKFNDDGMALVVHYYNGTSESVSDGWKCIYDFSKAGDTLVTVCYGDKSEELTVEVKEIPVTGLTVSPSDIVLNKGDTLDLTVSCSPQNATPGDYSFISDKPEVANVSSDGRITAVAAGIATIKVKEINNGKTVFCNVVVTDVSLSQNRAELMCGEQMDLDVVILPENGADKVGDLTWGCSDENVALVTDSGAVIAKSSGVCVISVSTNDKNPIAGCILTVSESQASVRLPGDINSDGKISLLDSTILRRYLAGWNGVTISESNADVNGDGEVTLLDSTVLRRYLAGWEGVELK